MKTSTVPEPMPADRATAPPDWSATEPWIRFGAHSIGIFFAIAVSGYLLVAGARAIVAKGSIFVEGAATTVSAARSGAIVELKVRSGDFVKSGEPILIMEDTQARADLAATSARLAGYAIQNARLVAERDFRETFEAPVGVELSDAATAKVFADEQTLFVERRNMRSAHEKDLPQRLADFDRKLAVASERIVARLKDRDLNEREMSVVGPLYDKGAANPQRVGDLQRQSVRIGADIATARADIAKLKSARGEAASQSTTDRLQDQQRTAAALSELTAKIAEAKDTQAELSRLSQLVTVVAPETGFVYDLAVAATGDQVRQGQPLAEIIAGEGRLLVGIVVRTDDAANVAIGNPVMLRLSSDGDNIIAPVSGLVRAIRSSATLEGSGAATSVVLVETSRSDAARGPGVELLRSGKLVEAQFAPRSSTMLSDLLAPLRKLFVKAFGWA